MDAGNHKNANEFAKDQKRRKLWHDESDNKLRKNPMQIQNQTSDTNQATVFSETHVFDTGIDNPAFINARICVMSASLEEAKVVAGKTRCSLSANKGKLFLIRDGVESLLSEDNITADAIPSNVRDRLIQAGCPIPADDPDLAEKALAGLKDESMVISSDELERVNFSFALLIDEAFCNLLNKADHIAFGVA